MSTTCPDNALLGAVDLYTVFAVATSVSGTLPSVNVYVDQSCDNRTWILGSSAIISGALSEGQVLHGTGPFAAFLRLRVTLGGTSPQCRLRLRVAGRDD